MKFSELFLPPRSLNYGIYQIKIAVNMQIYPHLLSIAVTYINIIPSQITVNLVQSGSSMINIGGNETLVLDPGSFSVDPDEIVFLTNVSEITRVSLFLVINLFLFIKNWIYNYYCRINVESIFIPISDPSCFGNRPGNRFAFWFIHNLHQIHKQNGTIVQTK